MKKKVKSISEKYHEQVHFACGILTGLLVYTFFRGNLIEIVAVSIIGAFLPDIDHLLHLFSYGKKSEYAMIAREVLHLQGFRSYIEHCKKNHKDSTGIVSHNFLVMAIFFVGAIVAGFNGRTLWMAFFLSCTFHFTYDILEDWLFFGRLNKNWMLHFNRMRE